MCVCARAHAGVGGVLGFTNHFFFLLCGCVNMCLGEFCVWSCAVLNLLVALYPFLYMYTHVCVCVCVLSS